MNVLFVCVANGGRSVMAERLFRAAAAGRHEARSAGSEPGAHAHAVVVSALAEVGIDASDHVPMRLDDASIEWADLVVSTCSEEVCPVTIGKPRVSWQLSDPRDRTLEDVRAIRDDIAARVNGLLAELDATSTEHT